MAIATKRVGATDVSVRSLAFGGASLGNLGGVVRDEDATAVMQHAWAAGIRYFDTAPQYGRGLSEQRIGAFLQTKPPLVPCCLAPEKSAHSRAILQRRTGSFPHRHAGS
ncbi:MULTISPECIES: aldo/keto reductase [unclassified Marinovum]